MPSVISGSDTTLHHPLVTTNYNVISNTVVPSFSVRSIDSGSLSSARRTSWPPTVMTTSSPSESRSAPAPSTIGSPRQSRRGERSGSPDRTGPRRRIRRAARATASGRQSRHRHLGWVTLSGPAGRQTPVLFFRESIESSCIRSHSFAPLPGPASNHPPGGHYLLHCASTLFLIGSLHEPVAGSVTR